MCVCRRRPFGCGSQLKPHQPAQLQLSCLRPHLDSCSFSALHCCSLSRRAVSSAEVSARSFCTSSSSSLCRCTCCSAASARLVWLASCWDSCCVLSRSCSSSWVACHTVFGCVCASVKAVSSESVLQRLPLASLSKTWGPASHLLMLLCSLVQQVGDREIVPLAYFVGHLCRWQQRTHAAVGAVWCQKEYVCLWVSLNWQAGAWIATAQCLLDRCAFERLRCVTHPEKV